MKKTLLDLTVYGVLIALILVFTFTSLGYLKIGVVEITLMCIPLIFGICYGRLKAGILLGALFGATSFYTCFGISAFGVALLDYSPLRTAFTCIVPRILTGVFASLIYSLIEKRGKESLAAAVLSVVTPVFNTVMFVSSFLILFAKSDYMLSLMEIFGVKTVAALIIPMFAVNAGGEIALCVLVGVPVCKAIKKISEIK